MVFVVCSDRSCLHGVYVVVVQSLLHPNMHSIIISSSVKEFAKIPPKIRKYDSVCFKVNVSVHNV